MTGASLVSLLMGVASCGLYECLTAARRVLPPMVRQPAGRHHKPRNWRTP